MKLQYAEWLETSSTLSPYTGFDAPGGKAWLMVPLDGKNRVLLRGGAPGGQQAKVEPKGIASAAALDSAQASSGDLLLTFRGSKPGRQAFAATLGKETVEIEVGVFAPLSRSVHFFKVPGSRRGSQDASDGLAALNAIFAPQANVSFSGSPSVVDVSESRWSARPMEPDGRDADILHTWMTTNWSGDLHVFFVGEIDLATGADTDGFTPVLEGYPQASKCIFIEDALGLQNAVGSGKDFQRALAHEVLHSLRRDTHKDDLSGPSNQGFLLYGGSPGGTRLRRDDVEKIQR
jgi:hypothetical protein